MSDRVNQIQEAVGGSYKLSELIDGEMMDGIDLERLATVFDAARDFADLLTSLADGSLVETLAQWFYVKANRPGVVAWDECDQDHQNSYRKDAAAVLAVLGLQEEV